MEHWGRKENLADRQIGPAVCKGVELTAINVLGRNITVSIAIIFMLNPSLVLLMAIEN